MGTIYIARTHLHTVKSNPHQGCAYRTCTFSTIMCLKKLDIQVATTRDVYETASKERLVLSQPTPISLSATETTELIHCFVGHPNVLFLAPRPHHALCSLSVDHRLTRSTSFSQVSDMPALGHRHLMSCRVSVARYVAHARCASSWATLRGYPSCHGGAS